MFLQICRGSSIMSNRESTLFDLSFAIFCLSNSAVICEVLSLTTLQEICVLKSNDYIFLYVFLSSFLTWEGNWYQSTRKCESSTLSPKDLHKNNGAFNLLIYYFAQCSIKVTNRKNIRWRTTDTGSSKTGTPQVLSQLWGQSYRGGLA